MELSGNNGNTSRGWQYTPFCTVMSLIAIEFPSLDESVISFFSSSDRVILLQVFSANEYILPLTPTPECEQVCLTSACLRIFTCNRLFLLHLQRFCSNWWETHIVLKMSYSVLLFCPWEVHLVGCGVGEDVQVWMRYPIGPHNGTTVKMFWTAPKVPHFSLFPVNASCTWYWRHVVIYMFVWTSMREAVKLLATAVGLVAVKPLKASPLRINLFMRWSKTTVTFIFKMHKDSKSTLAFENFLHNKETFPAAKSYI